MPALPNAPAPLLPRVAQRETGAVHACIERYSPLVWSLARSLSRDMALVEDTVQEIFIDLWKSAARFDAAKSSETTFVATIARRRVIDKRRSMSRRPETETIEDQALPFEDLELGHVDTRDEASHAAKAVQKLQPEQRQVLLLAVVEGLTHSQIATRTGLPLGTVKSHVRRGLAKVSEMIGGREPSIEGGLA